MPRICTAILALIFMREVFAAPAGQALQLRWLSGKLTLDAENAPLSQIVNAIAVETGMEVTGIAELKGEITIHFKNADLLVVLQELLAGVNYAVTKGYSQTRLVIVGKAAGTPSTVLTDAPEKKNESEPANDPAQALSLTSESPVVQMGASDIESSSGSPRGQPENKLATIEASSVDGDSKQLASLINDNDVAVQSSAFQALASQNKDTAIESLLAEIQDPTRPNRLNALQLLVQSAGADEQMVLDTLRQALTDPDPAFGSYAIQALASMGNSGSIDALTEAFNRMDASTRLATVQTLAGTQTGLLLLQQAASDPDETVSTAAKNLLKQLAGHS